ncbi:MAG: hypothetical protein K2Q09_06290, partial [Phycisphaerales bacterium]|nr:hypothetical protein [Phycisphaerales bacterium]
MHPAGRLIALFLLPAALLGACAPTGATALSGARIPAAEYAGAFQAARQTLRDYRFELDRVDAPQGVLTSAPRASPGLAKPWEVESGSAAVDDLLSFQQRTVQVAFITGEPRARAAGTP